MTYDPSNKSQPDASGKEPEKYHGVEFPEFEIGPSVIICAVAGAVLGFVLALWGTSEVSIIISVTVVFGVLSGLFGLFVPWYKPERR